MKHWRSILSWGVPEYHPGDIVELVRAVPSHIGLIPEGTRGVVAYGDTSLETPEQPLEVIFTVGTRHSVANIVDPEDLRFVSRERMPFQARSEVVLLTVTPVEDDEYSTVSQGSDGILRSQDPDGRWTVSVMLPNGYHADAHVAEADMVVTWPLR